MHPELLSSRTGRAVLGALAALVVAVLIGLAALWPSGGTSGVGILAGGTTEVAEVQRVDRRACPQSQTQACQIISARLTTGPQRGTSTTLSVPGTDVAPQVKPGAKIRVVANDLFGGQPGVDPIAGEEAYSFSDFERRSPLYILAALFAFVVIALARWKGVRSLLGLAASLALVLQFMVPAILEGSSPVLVALTGALAVMLVTIALSHGTGVTSLAAVLGATVSLLVTAALALLFVELASITGFSSEEAQLLQEGADSSSPSLSLEGLILAGIVVGALGVLDDVTITQASTVLAIHRADPTQECRRVFRSALGVGRDHLSATVNTLVLAYVGAALPILLIFEKTGTGFGEALNREAVAGEVVAMFVGSIGLVLAVPLTTALAAWLVARLPTAALAGENAHAHHH